VVATDGRQLLVQRGYPLPWKDNVLIRALPVFGCRELPKEEPVLLGRAGDQVTLEIGPWLLSFKTDNSLRFPDVDHVIPSTRSGLSRLHLDPQDADVLTRDLPKMPGRDDNHSPVILELGEPVRVCPADGEKPMAELVLARGRYCLAGRSRHCGQRGCSGIGRQLGNDRGYSWLGRGWYHRPRGRLIPTSLQILLGHSLPVSPRRSPG